MDKEKWCQIACTGLIYLSWITGAGNLVNQNKPCPQNCLCTGPEVYCNNVIIENIKYNLSQKVETLEIDTTNFSHVNRRTFKWLADYKNLSNLALTNNHIRTITSDAFQYLKNLKKVKINQTDLVCSCSLLEIFESSILFSGSCNYNGIKTEFKEVKSYDLQCNPKPPRNLSYVQLRESSVELSWKLPPYPDNNLEHYCIYVNNTINGNIRIENATVKPNEGCCSYQVRLKEDVKFAIRIAARKGKFVGIKSDALTIIIPKKSHKVVIGAVIGVVCLILLSAIIILLTLKQYSKIKYAPHLKPNPHFVLDSNKSLYTQASDLPYSIEWEFPRNFLSFKKMIGSGAFGQQVWLVEAFEIGGFKPRGKSIKESKPKRRSGGVTVRYKSHFDTIGMNQDDQNVVIKTLKEDSTQSDYIDLASELKILIQVGCNENIVNLLGSCTRGGKLCVILEYCPNGTLLNLLHSNKDYFLPQWIKSEEKFTYIDQIIIISQIIKGMEYLDSRQCHHRCLTSSNILIGSDNMIKISDFGRPRDTSRENVYMVMTQGINRIGESESTLPSRWIAPEALFGRAFSDKSHVWSFGVVLWEIYTLGDTPYPAISNDEILTHLKEQRRLTCPTHCPKEMYHIMKGCWETHPTKRPTFQQISGRVSDCWKQYCHDYLEHGGADNRNLVDTPCSSGLSLPAIDDMYFNSFSTNG